jgi:hypothetical protein
MPSDDDVGKPSDSRDGIIEKLFDGGLPQLLLSRPVQRALGRLVAGITDVPAAHFERWSSRIRNDTAAEQAITSAIAAAARRQVGRNEELIARGLQRWTSQLAERQSTREEIAQRTLDILQEERLPDDQPPPSEPFMRLFEDIAEKAASPDLADLMARILAGEIRKPGTISRRTLQITAVLDQEIISALYKIHPLVIDNNFIHIPDNQAAELLSDFALLSSISITNDVGLRSLSFDDRNLCRLRVKKQMIIIKARPSYRSGLCDGVNLTPIGQELISALPLPGESQAESIATGFKLREFVEKIEIADIDESGDELKLINSRLI